MGVCVFVCLSVSEQVCLLLTVTTNKEPSLYRTLSYIVVFEIKLYNNISAVRNVGLDQIINARNLLYLALCSATLN